MCSQIYGITSTSCFINTTNGVIYLEVCVKHWYKTVKYFYRASHIPFLIGSYQSYYCWLDKECWPTCTFSAVFNVKDEDDMQLIMRSRRDHMKQGINASDMKWAYRCVVYLKGFANFWKFSFYRQKKVADYEYHNFCLIFYF